MASAKQFKALIRSHAQGDDSRFYAVAMQVAAQAARQGHNRFAKELRELVDAAKEQTARRRAPTGELISMARPRGELAGLLTLTYAKTRLADMALNETVRSRLQRVVLEQKQRDRLRQHGLAPLRRLLLVGPPGTGKTMTANALAGELGLPLFTIQLDALITKYMGETAAKLRLVFDAIAQTRGLYLFDEFDALGGQRAAGNDVGEIRRVLNSFLQFLEHDESDSLIVGATNHKKLLDRALFRRFDSVIAFTLPEGELAEQLMRACLSFLDSSGVEWSRAVVAAEGLSHAEITRACEQAAKEAILKDRRTVATKHLVGALQERRTTSDE